MRQYNNYQLLHEVVSLNEGLKKSIVVGTGVGGVLSYTAAYALYDKRLNQLKQQLKNPIHYSNKELIRKRIHYMEKLGKKKWSAIVASKGTAIGATIGTTIGIGKKRIKEPLNLKVKNPFSTGQFSTKSFSTKSFSP